MLNSPKGGLFAGRFEIEHEAGSGGTGAVYAARDHFSGERIALKILHSTGSSHQEAERFSREAQLLAELCHPGIVSYVAHGTTADGQCYLAMEWLAGEDLSQFLSRGPLSVTDTLLVARRVAEALQVAHRRSVVHRDLKPTNLFVVDSQLEKIKILDFGIARRALTMAAVTRSGMLVGTPAYMAPEQAHGTRQITPATDIFSLGCVLFECLTGRPPFIADHVAAVLARVLFDEPPPLQSIRPDAPAVLETLLSRMLHKDPAHRIADATALLHELAQAEPLLRDSATGTTLPQPTTSVLSSRADSDQVLVNVVLAAPRQPPSPGVQQGWQTLTLRQSEITGPRADSHKTLRVALQDLGVNAEWLLDGSLVVTLAAHGYATDQVGRAAQVALAIKQHWPDSQVVLTTGLGAAKHNMLLGNAVERAARLMRDHEGDDDRVHSSPRVTTSPPAVPPPPARGTAPTGSGVWVDELSARLLERYYQLISTDKGMLLTPAQQSLDETRLLLGKATACVGREQELSTLDIVLNTCIDESSAKLVLVTGPAGFGKSRLRHEFLRRIAARGSDITVVYGRAEMASKGSAFAVLSQAIRRLCEIQNDQSSEEQQRLLTERIGKNLRTAAADRRRILEFLGEMCGVPFGGENSELLRAARSDPKIMKERVHRAFLDFIAAECSAAPLVLIVEDLHWGDALTVGLMEMTLRQHADLPLLMISLARPEVHELFPRLAKVFGSQELVLKGLGKKACERLIQQVLGKQVAPVLVDTLLRMSDGNPLFLEELIRSAVEPTPAPAGNADQTSSDASRSGQHRPYTVLAMLQARLSQLDPAARRVLRAASVFGQTFWRGGLVRMLGSDVDGLDRWIEHLVAMEHLERHRESRLGKEPEFAFRHSLLREAVYSLLTDFDRRAGHLAAAHYLLEAGEGAAQVIAEHFHLGGDQQRAAENYLQAAEHAYRQFDADGMLRFADLGSACAGDPLTSGTLNAILCIAYAARLDFAEALTAGEVAIRSLPLGSLWWCRTMGQLFVLPVGASSQEDHGARMLRLIELFARARPAPEALTAYASASAYLIAYTANLADRDHSFAFLIFLEQLAEPLRAEDRLLHGWTAYAQAAFCHSLDADPALAEAHAKQAVDAFARVQAQQGLLRAQLLHASTLLALGNGTDAEIELRGAVTLAHQLRDLSLASLCQAELAVVLSQRSDAAALKEAIDLAERAIGPADVPPPAPVASAPVSETPRPILVASRDPQVRGLAHLALSRAQLRGGQPAQAVLTCLAAAHCDNALPLQRLALQATHIEALLAQDQVPAAIAVAAEALSQLEALGGAGWPEVPLRLAAASAYTHAGQADEARRQLIAVEENVETRASRIADAKSRLRYLAQADSQQRMQALATTLGMLQEHSR
jgi:serine/threonine protein kinase